MNASNIGAGSQPSLERTIAEDAEQRHEVDIERGIFQTEHADSAENQNSRIQKLVGNHDHPHPHADQRLVEDDQK